MREKLDEWCCCAEDEVGTARTSCTGFGSRSPGPICTDVTMCRLKALAYIVLLPVLLLSCRSQPQGAPGQSAQNPSPMVENTRSHERIQAGEFPGVRFLVRDVLTRPIEVYVPEQSSEASNPMLLVHFHGAAYVAEYAGHLSGNRLVLAVVNLGSGSSVYEQAFSAAGAFAKLVSSVIEQLSEKTGHEVRASRVYLSAFSAGYGAVRAILRVQEAVDAVDGVILLDGLHTDYVPERVVLAEGGQLNTAKLGPFVSFAKAAAAGSKRFLITHSEIFPGTYASTTETTDYIIQMLHMKRTPVLEWGPGGMQQLSEVHSGRFAILGFAGNSAPDHVDHYHGLYQFLDTFLR